MLASRRAWALLLTAFAIGLLGDHLLRAPLWGLNVALGLTVMAAAAFAASRRPATDRSACADPAESEGRSETARWPWLAAAFFAAMWAVRDSEPLLVMNLLAALGLACLPLIGGGPAGLRRAGVVDVVAAIIGTAWRTATGGADLVRNLGSLPVAWRTVGAVGVGLLLAIPVVLIFGALFASADPLFDKMVSSLNPTLATEAKNRSPMRAKSNARARPRASTSQAAPYSHGRPRPRAKSFPLPSGMMPSVTELPNSDGSR